MRREILQRRIAITSTASLGESYTVPNQVPAHNSVRFDSRLYVLGKVLLGLTELRRCIHPYCNKLALIRSSETWIGDMCGVYWSVVGVFYNRDSCSC